MWGGFERRSGIWRDESVTRAQNESRTWTSRAWKLSCQFRSSLWECENFLAAIVKLWMTPMRVQLTEDKTERLLTCPKKFLGLSLVLFPTRLSFSLFFRQFGGYSSSKLDFSSSYISCLQYYLSWSSEVSRISSTLHDLTPRATDTYFVLARIDYWNSLLPDIPKYRLDRHQRNDAARLISSHWGLNT